jgi:hypothetical protein
MADSTVNLQPMRLPALFFICGLCPSVSGQSGTADATGRYMITEEIGLPLSRAALVKSARLAWERSFGLEPGSRLVRQDEVNGVMEGTARFNYRSRVLTAREETMGTITYLVSIHMRNGHCTVLVHDLVHRGNRDAPGGGMNLGHLLDGDAPATHYPGMGLTASRKIHADMRQVAGDRIREVMRQFTSIMRQAGP